jgi:hypothetical protein
VQLRHGDRPSPEVTRLHFVWAVLLRAGVLSSALVILSAHLMQIGIACCAGGVPTRGASIHHHQPTANTTLLQCDTSSQTSALILSGNLNHPFIVPLLLLRLSHSYFFCPSYNTLLHQAALSPARFVYCHPLIQSRVEHGAVAFSHPPSSHSWAVNYLAWC